VSLDAQAGWWLRWGTRDSGVALRADAEGPPGFGSDGAGAKARKRTWIHVGPI
jgi:hypothetical protein